MRWQEIYYEVQNDPRLVCELMAHAWAAAAAYGDSATQSNLAINSSHPSMIGSNLDFAGVPVPKRTVDWVMQRGIGSQPPPWSA
jgi:hypothetical protein